jgi:hypothetical protein
MTTVNVHQAKTHLSRLLEQVAAGEDRRGGGARRGGQAGGADRAQKEPRRPALATDRLTDALFESLPDELAA